MSVGEHCLLGMSAFCIHGRLAAVITFIKLGLQKPCHGKGRGDMVSLSIHRQLMISRGRHRHFIQRRSHW